MAIIVSGTYIKFDSGSVAQSEFYNEAFGSTISSASGNTTIPNNTIFDSQPTSPGIKLSSQPEITRKTSAPVTISSPKSGSVTVAPMVSTVYVYAVGGGGGAAGITGPATYGAGTAGTPSFFSTVIGGGGGASSGIPGGTGGPATGGTTNTPGVTATNAPTGPGVDALPGGASGTGAAGGAGGSAPTPGTGPGGTGALYGGGGGGAEHIPLFTAFRSGGGGGGGFALHPAFPVVGGSPYPYQAGVGGPGGPGAAVGGSGGNGRLILEFFD